MKTTKKTAVRIILLLMLILVAPAGGMRQVQAASKMTATYVKRASRVRKRLPVKVRNLLKKGYARPSCVLYRSKRKGRNLTCWLSGGIGEGAYEIRVRVNLRTGRATVLDDMVSIPDHFKVSMK